MMAIALALELAQCSSKRMLSDDNAVTRSITEWRYLMENLTGFYPQHAEQ